MCSQITDCNAFCFNGSSKQDLLQGIFHTSKIIEIETSTELIVCEHCLECIIKLRECYENYKNAQKIYEETLLRVQCYRKCANAKQVTAAETETANSTPFNVDSDKEYEDDHFEESYDYNPTSIKIEPELDIEIDESITTKSVLEPLKLKAYKRKPYKPTYNYKGEQINRRGGLTDEEYQEHHRLQKQQHYLAKKRKLDKRALEDNPGQVHSEYSDPLSALPSKVGTEAQSESSSKSQPKKKYDYRGKSIHRRNNLDEEQYQKHRREQNAQYYFERKKRLGKLAYGPRLLRHTLRAKLERAENVTFDSNNLPAKSSWGAQVPLIQLGDDGKRFSYRNTEFSKHEDTYTCEKCGHITNNPNVMKKHIAKLHFDKEHGYKCSYCEKSFYYRFQLRNHEGSHTEKGAGIQCEECGKSFKHSSGYFYHRRIVHLGIKPHECQLCQKQFGTRKDLRKHTESIAHRSKENSTNETG